MGAAKGPYNAEFPAGTRIRIAPRPDLERFREEWRYHDPLEAEQLDFADRVATVSRVGFYHGGDELYELADIPGIWHECCLRAEEDGTPKA